MAKDVSRRSQYQNSKADMFAVIADTTANVSHVNQLSVLARYVDQDIQLSVVARYVGQEGYAQEHLVDIQGIDDKMVEGHAQGIQHRLPSSPTIIL